MTKKRKAPSLNDGEDIPIVYCWFCEREFADKMVLTAHQKAKHFTCLVCQKKLNSVSGTAAYCTLSDVGLQNHMKSMHILALETVANALPHRSDPANVPDISGMDGIPLKDLQEYKSRVHPTTPAPPPLPPPKPIPKPPSTPAKKTKVDTPLSAEAIQAQLSAFHRKKEQEEINELKANGILFPPGVPESKALALFAFRSVPPGTGPYAAKSLPFGKSAPFLPPPLHTSSASSTNLPKPAPPPSLKFTKTEVVLSLSPPTPAPLAPGQSPLGRRTSVIEPTTGSWVNGPGSSAVSSRGIARGRVQRSVAARGSAVGRGYQSYPQNVGAYGQVGRGMVPGQFRPPVPPGYPPPPPQPYPSYQTPRPGQPPLPVPLPTPPRNFPPAPPQGYPQQPYAYPVSQSYSTPAQYPAQAKTYTPGQSYSPPPQPYQQAPYPPTAQPYAAPYVTQQPPRPPPPPPNISFEQLYPMHGKKASDFPASAAPPISRPYSYTSAQGFTPPAPAPPPTAPVYPPTAPPGPPQQYLPAEPVSTQRVDVRIIVDDYVSPVFPF